MHLPFYARLFSFILVLLVSNTSFAAPEVIPNKPINEAQAKAITHIKADPNTTLGKLKIANSELTSQNATLTQENNALQTQVNVLTQERSSQIFMTGAFVAIGGIFLGFIAAWLLAGRRRSSDW